MAMDDESHLDDGLWDGTIETWRIVVASFLCWMVTSFAVAAGIGGGGLLVPLYTIILGLDTKRAVPLSKSTIFGVACGNVFYIAFRRHPQIPNIRRPLIDYATVLLMQPGELMGVIIGVLMNRFLPEVMVIILLVLVLGFTSYTTLQKGRLRWRKESEAMAKIKEEEQDADEEAGAGEVHNEKGTTTTTRDAGANARVLNPVAESGIFYEADGFIKKENEGGIELALHEEEEDEHHDNEGGDSNNNYNNNDDTPPESARNDNDNNDKKEKDTTKTCFTTKSHLSSEDETLLQEIYDKEAIQFNPVTYAVLFAMTAYLILYSMLLNGKIWQDLDNCRPAAYWPLYWSPLLVFGAIVAHYWKHNLALYKLKERLGFVFAEGDIRWDVQTASRLAPAAVAAGVAAGLLGIGGGMILGPLFVSLEFQPQVGAASTGFMILFTALSGTVQYLAVGKLPWRYALWFGSIGCIGGQTGQRVVKRLIDYTGRPSIVVLLLGSIIGVAVIIMALSGSINVAQDARDGENIWKVDSSLFVCEEDD